MSDARDTDARDDIAIIGMAGRFPQSRTLQEFWEALKQGTECIRSFTPEELRASGIDASVLDDPSYVNAGAPLEEAECFDAAFFGYHPRDAELMDPQHRVFLECAWSALEDAGYDSTRFDGVIGAFGGVARNTYLMHVVASAPERLTTGGEYRAIISTEKDFSVTRIAYMLDLRGPCINVQTACSTSGVAVHLACQSLLNGECDMALAGGTRVHVPVMSGYW